MSAKVTLRELTTPAPTPGGVELTSSQLIASSTGQDFLVPITEPQTSGAPPVTPDLVGYAAVGRAVRRLRAASGQLVLSPLTTSRREVYRVGWSHINRAQEQQLREFFGKDGTSGGLFAFDLEPDGPGSGTITVRPLEAVVFEFVSPGVYRVPEFRVEGVIS